MSLNTKLLDAGGVHHRRADDGVVGGELAHVDAEGVRVAEVPTEVDHQVGVGRGLVAEAEGLDLKGGHVSTFRAARGRR